jgi:tape measure domain-containing protein
MAQQINATMSTSVALDLLQASNSIKSLTRLVSSNQSAWKAQEAEMKSAGDMAGAAQAKYEGLGRSIADQQAKIDALKNKQSELKGNTAETAQQYLKYQQQIDGATKQLASMQAQQDRAKQAMDYQKSGLAGLQSEYTAAARANKAYVERLQAEGNQQEANKAKMEGYKSSITNLNEQLSKQSSELDKIASASGKDSDAWRTQKMRVDETATSLAHAKSSMANLSDEMEKMNPSPWARLKSSITETNDKAKKTHSIFHEVFSADMASNIVKSAWQHLSGWIGTAVDSAKEYSLAQQTMNATWTTLTGNASEGKKMVNMTDQMAISANNATEMVDQLNQKFFAINHSADGTKALTKSVLTLQDAFGQTDDAVMNFGTQFAQMMANGKVGAQDMMSFVNTFPVLRTNLLKTEQQITGNHKMTMSQMNDLMSAGKISSSTMEKVLESTAKEYGKATENFGKTIPGMIRTAKSQIPVLLSAISSPLTKAANPVVGAVSNWVASPKTKTAFSSLGKTFSDGLNKAISSMSGGASNGAGMTKALDNGIQGLQKTVSGFFGFLATHGKDLAGITGSLGTIVKIFAGTIWHTIAGVVSGIAKSFGLMGSGAKKSADPLKNANTALGNIAKNKSGIQTIAKIVLGLWAAVKGGEIASKIAKGAITAISGAMDLFSKRAKIMAAAQKALNFVVEANPWIKLAVVILAVGTALVELYKHNAKFKAFVDGIVKSVQNMWKGMEKWISQLVKGWNNAWKSVGKGWNGFLKTMGSWGKSIASAWNKIWAPITKGMSAVWKGVVNVTKSALNVLKLAIVLPIALIVGLAIKAWQKIEKPFMTVWNDIAKFIKPILTSISKFITGTAKDVSSAWNKYWQFVAKFYTGIWNTIVKAGTTAFNTVSKGISSFLSAVNKVWTESWNAISKFFSSIWNGIVKLFTPIINGISSTISTVVNAIKKTWSTVWGAISKFFGDTWNSMVKFYSPIIHGISSTIGSVINTIKKVWKDVWGDVGSFFGGIWDGIKKAAESGINFVVSVIRAGLSAVNDVLGFFGVKKVGLPSYVHFAQGGEVGKDGTQLAMVNDDGSEHYKELIHKKRTNQWIYAEKRNTILPLETGDRIYNGKESKAIADMYGIPGFAQGGIIGSVWDGIKNATSYVADKAEDVGKWIGDKVTAITDWIAHPIKHVTVLIEKSIGSLIDSAPVKAFGQLGEGIFKHAYNGIAAWISKQLKKIQDSTDLGGGAKKSYPELEALARQAASIMGVNPSDDFIKALANVAMSESGGNAGAANLTDDNARAGMASVGLLQYIPSTWAYYNVPGHNNRNSVLDNFIHFFNNSDWQNSIGYVTYPSWGGMYKWDWRNNGPQGAPRMANGGLINRPISAIVGEDGPEAIMPLGAAKASRAWQLLGQAVSNINQNLGASSTNNGQSDSDISDKLDTLISLFTIVAQNSQSDSTSVMSSNRFADQLAKMLAPKMQQQLTNQKLRGGVII